MSTDIRKDKLTRVVAAAAGLSVIWVNQNKVRPAYPYVALNIVSEQDVAHGDVRKSIEERELEVDEDPETDVRYIEKTIRYDEELTLSINTFSKPDLSTDAASVMRAIRRAFAWPNVLADLREAGLSVAVVGEARDLSSAADGDILLRSQMDVQLNAVEVVTPESERGGFIERVQGTITLSELERDIEFDVDASGG